MILRRAGVLATLSVMAFLTQFLLYISGFPVEYPMAARILFFLCAMYFIFQLWLDLTILSRRGTIVPIYFDESDEERCFGQSTAPPLTALARHKTAVSAGRSLHELSEGDGDCPA